MMASFLCGKTNYPVGILEGGKTFCPEQALVDLELAREIHRTFGPLDVSDETLAVDVVRSAGIGGNVLAHAHTLDHFRKTHTNHVNIVVPLDVGSTGTTDLIAPLGRTFQHPPDRKAQAVTVAGRDNGSVLAVFKSLGPSRAVGKNYRAADRHRLVFRTRTRQVRPPLP